MQQLQMKLILINCIRTTMKILKIAILILLLVSLQGCGTAAYVAGKTVGTAVKAGVDTVEGVA